MKKLALFLAALVLVAAASGCTSEQKDKIATKVKGAACKEIPKVQDKLGNVQNMSQEDLKKVQSAAKSASTAIKAVEDKLPSGAADKVATATQDLSDKIDNAKTDTQGSKEELQKSADELSADLDEVSKDLEC